MPTTSKKSIVAPLSQPQDKRGKTVSGLTYYTAGDGVGFSVKCPCGKDHVLTDAVVDQIKKELAAEAKKSAPKMELQPVTFDKIGIGEVFVATTDANGHGYPINYPVMKTCDKREGGYCVALPGGELRGQTYPYFFQDGRMQVNVHRIKAVNQAFLDRFKDKHLKKFFTDIPVKKL